MADTAHLLNASVEVWRAVLVSDGGGGQTTSWVQQPALRARLSQPSAREREAADQSGSELTHVAYLPAGSNVRRGDELRQPGLVLEVTAVFQPSVSGTYLRADCTARQSS